MKSSDMSVMLGQSRVFLLIVPAVLMGVLTLFFGVYVLQNLSFPQWIVGEGLMAVAAQLGILVFLILVTLLVAIATLFIARKIFFGSKVALRFLDLQFRINGAVHTWKSIRKQIEAIVEEK
jgi:hypothetical protein